jgi:hypothetical protein
MGRAGIAPEAPLPQRSSEISYRGYRLRQHSNLGWSVEPQEGGQGRGFSTPPSSLADVRALIDWRLDQAA